MRLILAAALAFPALAEFREIRFTIEDSGCASCGESLQKRLGRVRGVESVEIAAGDVVVKLAAGNTARLEQLRDFVEQGGNRLRRVAVTADGEAAEGWFQPSGLATKYQVEGNASGQGRLMGESNSKLEKFRVTQWIKR